MGRIGGKVNPQWTVQRLSHAKEFFVNISDTINQPIISIHIKSVTNPIHTIIQIAEVAAHEITKGRFNLQIILVDLGSSVHRSGVVHVYTLGHQGAQHKRGCASSTIGTSILQKMRVVFFYLCNQFRLRIVIITLTHRIIQTRHHGFDVHIIQDLLNELILEFRTIHEFQLRM